MDEPASSLTERVRPIEAGAHVTAAAFLGPVAVFALGDGSALRLAAEAEERIMLHPEGAILVAMAVGKKLVTGGDDGRVVALAPDGTWDEIFHEPGKWIDALAGRDDGAVAWSSGKQVFARDAQGNLKTFAAPSTVRGLAFSPKGYRLAIAHYNGASLWFPNAAATPDALSWKGAHLDTTFSPDGRFLVTSMQENALHGWRLSDKRDMRMSGYAAKTRSLSWSRDGHWLATSGAEACIVWPFKDKDGPMRQQPRECGVRRVKVSRVACHPKALVVAIGYDDGWILMCRMTDGAEILVRRTEAGTQDAVTALSWDDLGRRLIFGTREGHAGLLDVPG